MYDINEVCRLLGTTSRTLRYYEEKGLITSTKAGTSPRRHYTDAQIEQIRRVMALRTLGLSIRTIGELQQQTGDLRRAVLARRAEILASIEAKQQEIALLSEALAVLEAGDDLFDVSAREPLPPDREEAIAAQCARAIVEGDTAALYRHLGAKLTAYMPSAVYETVRADTLEPLGDFIDYSRSERDTKHPHVYYHYVGYARLGLKIKLVFHRGAVEGLWRGYYEDAKGGKP